MTPTPYVFHQLLARQIRKHLGGIENCKPDQIAFIEAVDDAYRQFENGRELLERSIDISSAELVEANRKLVTKNIRLTLLHRLLTVMQEAESDREVFEFIVGELAAASRLPVAVIETLDDSSGNWNIEASVGLEGEVHPTARSSALFRAFVRSDDLPFGAIWIDGGTGQDLTSETRELVETVAVHIGNWLSARKARRQVQEQQAQLVNAARMSALGQMAGGVAHEINNPLAIIQSLAEEICEMAPVQFDPACAQIRVFAEKILKSSSRAAKIISGLRAFSRDGSNDPFQSVSLRKLFEETVLLSGESFRRHDVRFIDDGVPEELMLECRGVQISQILLNLIQNAIDAVSELEERWVRVTTFDLGDKIEMRVTDSGGGIPPHLKERIFQPFFTTKEVGKGTGLGLSICLGLAKSHNGDLSLVDDCEHTCFRLVLPKRVSSTLSNQLL